MAVVSAKIADIEEQTVNWMKAVELGNSYSVRTGDMVLAVGSPSGHVHSVKQGTALLCGERCPGSGRSDPYPVYRI